MQRLHDLYVDIVCDALVQQPICLVLDDIHNCSEADIAVLGAISQRLQDLQQPGQGSLLVCTANAPVGFQALNGQQQSRQPACMLHDVRGVVRVVLHALDDDAVMGITKERMRCAVLDPFVFTTIEGALVVFRAWNSLLDVLGGGTSLCTPFPALTLWPACSTAATRRHRLPRPKHIR